MEHPSKEPHMGPIGQSLGGRCSDKAILPSWSDIARWSDMLGPRNNLSDNCLITWHLEAIMSLRHLNTISWRQITSSIRFPRKVHCGENSRIFRDAADQTLPVTEISGICNLKIKFSYISRNFQLQVTFGLLHLGKSRSFRHSVLTMLLHQQ
jgi:hypothetical protein